MVADSEPRAFSFLANQDLSEVSLKDLLTPVGKTFLEWHQNKTVSRSKKTKEVSLPLKNEPAIKTWRHVMSIGTITAKTLFPVGILILLYNMAGFEENIALQTQRPLGGHPLIRTIANFVGRNPSSMKTSDLMPVGILFGRDVFENVIEICR